MPHTLTRLLVTIALAATFVGCSGKGCGDTREAPGEDKAAPAKQAKPTQAPGEDKAAEAQPEAGTAENTADAAPAKPIAAAEAKGETHEEIVVLKAAAAAIKIRDVEALQALFSPELRADLQGMYESNPTMFWRRADVLRGDVESGATISHRRDTDANTWRVLVTFGNTVEESMVFMRVQGAVKIDVL